MSKKISCIYKIINIVNGKFYLGSTDNFLSRVKRHKKDLSLNRHHNIHLQRAYNKHGSDKFEFKVFEKCFPSNRIKREQYHLDRLNPKNVYNVSGSATGGDLIKNHPNREKIIKQKTEILMNLKNNPNYKKPDFKGNKNPNYGKKWNKSLRKKVSKIVKKRYANMTKKEKKELSKRNSLAIRKFHKTEKGAQLRKKWSKDRKGNKNSFYGKKHSKKTKQKISKAHKGIKPVNSLKVQILGKIYESIADAAKDLKIPMVTANYRIHSTNPKFKEWNFYGETKEVKDIDRSNVPKSPVTIKGVCYASIIEASRCLGIKIGSVAQKVNSPLPKYKDWKYTNNKPRESKAGNPIYVDGKKYKSYSDAARKMNINYCTVLFRVKSKNPKWKNWKRA